MIEGSLRNVPLTDVFQVLATSQKSGTLTLSRGRSRASVHFERGRIRYAHLSPGVHLGEILLRMELLDLAEVLVLLQNPRTEGPGPELGLVALNEGRLTEEELHAALERQVVEVLGELLTWWSGNFSFGEGDEAKRVDTSRDFDAMTLLMQVSQQFDDREESVAPTLVFRQVGDPTRADIPQSGWEVLAAVDGRRCAASIAAEVDLPERQAIRLLHLLEEAGVIERSPFQLEAPPVLLLSPSQAYGRILRLLLLRNRAFPRIETDWPSALAFLAENQPRAIVLDDHDGSAWQFARELRRMPGKAHLPVLVLTAPGAESGVLTRMRRPRALTLDKPFGEVAFQNLINRMTGSPAT